jgi:two-component system LytT family sensor kinase
VRFGLDAAGDSRQIRALVRRRYTVITIAAWAVIALLSVTEEYLYMQRTGRPMSLATGVASHAPAWAVWALATAPIVALSRRFRLAWPPRLVALAVHVAMCAATGAGFIVVSTLTNRAFGSEPAREGLVASLWHHLLGWMPFLLMGYACVAGVGHALTYAAQVRHEQHEKAGLATQLVEAQLGALRMQLQPHFLFNTLNSVAMLIRSADHARAVEMIALLGDVLRSLLRSSSDLESTLDAELDLLRRYLEIEQIRFGDRLTVVWRVEAAAREALVPPLILQPVVENALRHGLWPRPEGGELAIAARRAGDALELEVADQGVGLAPGFALGETRGVGLANVRARLERMYGAAAGCEVAGGAAGGVCVRLRMPFHSEPRFERAPGAEPLEVPEVREVSHG